ncbi:SBBP repeat-containing protein [Telluribacter humicola]|uniref:SBBP repeat-containing protein n=1 Tax=Telluribacter humicola TaxID=1720261 RepID=UPI001A96FAF0|nr:SBBP repeat-containing protein [Telluribacter humicola]
MIPGEQTITAEGGLDLFLAKLNSSGTLISLLRDGGARDEVAYGIATDSDANVYLTGYFHSPSRLGGKALTSAGGGLFLIQ